MNSYLNENEKNFKPKVKCKQNFGLHTFNTHCPLMFSMVFMLNYNK